MTAAAVPAVGTGDAATTEPVACWTCGHIVAKRFASGGYIVLVPGPVKVDDGRMVIVCPNCGAALRFDARKGPRPRTAA